MATETYFLPGYGIVVDEEDGDEYFLPGYGVVANNEAAATNIQGTRFNNQNLFNNGLITLDIAANLFQDADTFFDGNAAIQATNLDGSILTDDDNFLDGRLNYFIDFTGTQFSDPDTFFNGQLNLALLGSLFQDEDSLFHGSLATPLFGSLFQDADQLFHGSLTYLIHASKLVDDDSLFHGSVSLGTIEGSIYQDPDVFNEGSVRSIIQGSVLEDADSLFHGNLNLTIRGSIHKDTDQLFHGEIQLGTIQGTLLQNANIFNQGVIGLPDMDGSLFVDDDNFFGGEMGGVGITPVSVYKIIRELIVGNAEYVDLVEEVVYVSASGFIIGKHGVPIDEDTV